MTARIELRHPDMYEFGPRSHVCISDASIPKYAVIHAIATMMGRIVDPDFYSPVQAIFARRPLKISYRSGESLNDEGIWTVFRQVGRGWGSLSRYTDREGYLECGEIKPYSTERNEREFWIEFYVGQKENQPLNCSDWARIFEEDVKRGELDKLISNKINPKPKPK